VQERRPVGETLRALDGAYTIVYSYVPDDSANPWHVYAPDAPAWASDLAALDYGQGYWIYATDTANLLLRGAAGLQSAAASALSLPPATLYGTAAAAGQPVVASVGGAVCGRATTRLAGGRAVFVIKVAAASADAPACGAAGRAVLVTVAGRAYGAAGWDNTRALDPGAWRVRLPIVMR
jgi:hypothetical protein